jgi:26S proteasome regulatory subunit N10
VVCVDNSEFTRNGDYAPTRFQAQADAVNLLAGAKTQHHPENTVGVMTMAGKTPQVLVTPTPDLGKVLNAMQGMKIEGEVHLSTTVQIAQLALKHRENKNQRQRIVVFVGSPISEDKVSASRRSEDPPPGHPTALTPAAAAAAAAGRARQDRQEAEEE